MGLGVEAPIERAKRVGLCVDHRGTLEPMPRLALLLAMVLVVVACGDDGSAPTTLAPTTTQPASTTVAGPPTGTDSVEDATTTTASTTTTTTTTVVETTTTTESPIERATGSGTVTLDDEVQEVEVVACGWLSPSFGNTEPLEAEENFRNDFRLLAVGQEGDEVFIVQIDRDGVVGAVYVDVINAVRGSEPDDPRNFRWGNERQSYSRVVVNGGQVATPEPLIVLEDTVDLNSPPHDLTLDLTCDTFGGIPDEAAEQIAHVTGIELHSFGASGTLTIDGTSYPLTTLSCSGTGGAAEGLAESPEQDLVVAVTDRGIDAAGILSDTIGVDIGDRSLIADEGVDIILQGTVLSTAEPVPLFDIYTRESAGTATVTIDCG